MKDISKFDYTIHIRNLQIAETRETHMDQMIEYFKLNKNRSPSLKKCMELLSDHNI